jgi:hypothetical protein
MSEIVWGYTLCSMRHCVALAECTYDDEPYCLDCADYLIDRQGAIALDGRMRALLPGLDDR